MRIKLRRYGDLYIANECVRQFIDSGMIGQEFKYRTRISSATINNFIMLINGKIVNFHIQDKVYVYLCKVLGLDNPYYYVDTEDKPISREDSDFSVKCFIEKCCSLDENEKENIVDLYQCYLKFADSQYLGVIKDKTNFMERLIREEPSLEYIGTINHIRYVSGIRLTHRALARYKIAPAEFVKCPAFSEIFKQFAEEYLSFDQSYNAKVSDIYSSYNEFCKGNKYPLCGKTYMGTLLSRYAETNDLTISRFYSDANGRSDRRIVIGCRLKNAIDNAVPEDKIPSL